MTSLLREPLMFVATSDLSGIIRGKSFPTTELEKRKSRGVGWTPTNVQITCFDTIGESPFGSLGDLMLVPDLDTRITIETPGEPQLDLALGDIKSLEGEPWEFCTRAILKRAIRELHDVSGALPFAAFEHEFQLRGARPRPGDAFGLKGYRDAQTWAETLLGAMNVARCMPDTFMKEYGPGQYEVTNKPALGVAAADNAAILRLLVHDVLPRFGLAPSFAPILDPASVGNGVHLHLSFVDAKGTPLTYDAADPWGMSALTRHFIGGVLAHLDQILALLAPSEISYLRLTPHRWSAAFNNLGFRDREASVRICPVTSAEKDAIARQYNFEIRALDSAASPHLAMAAILFAGAEGIRQSLSPPQPTQEDLSLLSASELSSRGFRRLPTTLQDALTCLGKSDAARRWFGNAFVDVYLAHKAAELAHLDGLDWAGKCAAYAEVY